MTSPIFDVKVRISEIVISDQTVLSIQDTDALVIVGPNNAGKSQLLRDIEQISRMNRHQPDYIGKVVKSLKFHGMLEHEILANLREFRVLGTDNYIINGLTVHQNYVQMAFGMGVNDYKFGDTAPWFVKRVSSDDRLSIVSPSPALSDGPPTTPGQILYEDESLLASVSSLFHKAFSKELFLDYRSGGQIPLYVGKKPNMPPGCDRVSDGYVNLVRACDKLHEQGDGMKSFGGIMLSTLVTKFNITLVDEPEAFLHPPQERIVGKVIAEETIGQLICSTHSSNILQGVLQSKRDRVRVIRLTRDKTVNNVKEISPEEIKQLWNDPVFRYSTALDALFHDRAVLCEAEPDCRFYEAIEQHLTPEGGADSHYIPCAGKAAFPKFARALIKLGVPVYSILDLDVLNDEGNISRIYEAHGGDWSTISHLWKRLDAAVRSGVKTDTLDEIKEKVSNALEKWMDGPPPTSQVAEIFNQRKAWGIIKEGGTAVIPSGEAQKNLEELMSRLAAFRIFPLPVGTLEKLVNTVGRRGNKWLAGVFETYTLDHDKLEPARQFVKKAILGDA